MVPSRQLAMPQESWRCLSCQPPQATHPHNRADSIDSHHRTQISRQRVWVFVPWLDLPLDEQVLYAAIRKYRSIFADKAATILAVSTEANGAFHIAFHREKDVLCRDAPLLKLKNRKTHHDLWSAD